MNKPEKWQIVITNEDVHGEFGFPQAMAKKIAITDRPSTVPDATVEVHSMKETTNNVQFTLKKSISLKEIARF